MIITTERSAKKINVILAETVAEKYSIEFRPRNQKTIDELVAEFDHVIVAKHNSLILYSSAGELFFHSNMSHLRVKNLKCGMHDRMIEAMQLTQGMTVLDCTLGLASDSIVASYVTKCRVVGLESSKLLSVIVDHGLHNFTDETQQIIEAMNRIEVINIDHHKYLQQLPAKSFDIVYFDPMFRQPVIKSQPMNALRSIVNPNPVTAEVIELAKNVAKHRIVMKEHSNSREFNKLGFSIMSGGKYSSVAYGFIEL